MRATCAGAGIVTTLACCLPLQPLPPLAAGDVEWNRAFMRRWRTVKKHAYLQVQLGITPAGMLRLPLRTAGMPCLAVQQLGLG